MSFSKSSLLEFRFCHDLLKSTKFNPLQHHLVKFCICAEFHGDKIVGKVTF